MISYIKGNNIQEVLEKYYSKSDIKRKIKEGSISIGKPHANEIWIKIGKDFIIIQEELSEIATKAQIWWEYHNQLMPKVIKWEKYK
jgi:hypothetical protein